MMVGIADELLMSCLQASAVLHQHDDDTVESVVADAFDIYDRVLDKVRDRDK